MENLLPDLTAEEYQRLKESIKEHGVLVPVSICAHTGRILDGNHRVRACNEIGIDYPRALVSLPDEPARRAYARSINLIRRTLTTQQRKAIICTHIKEFYTKSDRQLGIEMGIDHKTVGKYRKELTVGGEIPQVVANEGADGKLYTRKPVTVFAPNERQARALKKPGVAERMIEDGMTSAKNALARIHKEEKAERKDIHAHKITAQDIRLIHGDIRNGFPTILDCSINLCLTDAPYARMYTTADKNGNGDVYEPLSKLCERVLVDGGSLLCMTGLYYLPEVIASLGKHLAYHWQIALQLQKSSSKTFDKYMAAHWKPILFYTKGKLQGGDWYEDVYQSPPYNPADRENHPHGQSLEVFTTLAYRHSDSGQTILDVFNGGGTTALAAISQGRRYIGCDLERKHLETTQRRIHETFGFWVEIE